MSTPFWPLVVLALIAWLLLLLVIADLDRRAAQHEVYVPMLDCVWPDDFTRHTNDALAMVETPIFDDLAADVAAREAAGLDDEWLRFGGAR